MGKNRNSRDYQMRVWKRNARRAREYRRKRVYLLSLQTLSGVELEKTFRQIRDGEVELVGLREKPNQHVNIRGFAEYDIGP